MAQLRETLKEHHLRTTTCREDVLSAFIARKTALSHGDLESTLGENYDRVTIYRTLKTFLEKGIIHKVLDDEGLRYALCSDHCSDDKHQHDHVHFKCNQCGQTNCLENIHIPSIALPKGYKPGVFNLLIQGTCPACNG
jgi:Fur family ferric uptake transcriptional regulator